MKKISILLFLLSIFFLPTSAHGAAEMYLNLDKSQVSEQGDFTGTIYVSTGGSAINNAEGTIRFPTDLMSVSSLNVVGSIFNIWVEQPGFSNTNGTISFNGGLPTPGYVGQSGPIITVRFKSKKTGVANITFESPAVRANDGKGTDILSQTRSASISIVASSPAAVPETVPEVVKPLDVLAGTPKAPVIISSDMPDAQKWYNKNQATFTWDVPSGVSMLRLILASSADKVPTVSYSPAIAGKTLTDLSEGIQYLNARFKNSAGWGKIASRKIQVDYSNPENLIVKPGVSVNDLITLDMTAKDSVSGVKDFVVYRSGTEITRILASADGAGHVNLAALPQDSYTFIVKAFDKAGNNVEAEVMADAPATKAPRITHYPEFIKVGSKIEIRGKAPYTDGEVLVWVKQDSKAAQSFSLKPDEDRIFSYTSDVVMDSGTVSVWAETVRAPGITSAASDKVYVSVKKSDVVVIGTQALQTISIVITAVVLLLGLLSLFYVGIKRFNAAKRKLRRERVHTEQQIHKVFEMLKGDTRKHVKLLEMASVHRKLTKEESKILAELSENLHETELYLAEKVEDVKK